jgi:pimeloyl-ACP methyl ester carboxylesterase
MPISVDVKRFSAKEVALSYVEGPPNGEPVLLIHGVSSRWQPFQTILPALAEGHHVYALDLRGHGRSGHTPGAYRLDDYTRDLQEFIRQVVQRPVVVYGHSLGGLVAINLAARQPHNMRKLVLGDPPLFYHDTDIRDTFWYQAFQDLLDLMLAFPDSNAMDAWLAQNKPMMSPDRREERVRSLEGTDPDVVRAILTDELMQGISFLGLLSSVTCPVLLLRGRQNLGSALREQDVQFARDHFQDLRLLDMQRVGHAIIPPEMLPQVINFIDA